MRHRIDALHAVESKALGLIQGKRLWNAEPLAALKAAPPRKAANKQSVKFAKNKIYHAVWAACMLMGGEVACAQASISATGDTSPVGTGSLWNLGSTSLNVGNSATGTLSVSGGGVVNLTPNGSLDIGRNSGASGTVTVSGRGSALNVGKDLGVGVTGDGEMNILDGAVVSTKQGYVGRLVGSNGNVTIRGEGSQWLSTSFIYIGNFGKAELLIEDQGAVVAQGVIDIGRNADPDITQLDTDTVWVKGQGSLLSTARSLNVGRSTGAGVLIAENKSTVQSQEAYIGREVNSDGKATIQGEAQWAMTGVLNIGYQGAGALTIDSKGQVQASTVAMGVNAGSAGILNVQGGGILETASVSKGSGSAAITVDGGEFRATADQASFFQGFGSIDLGTDGMVFDTSAFQVGMGASLSLQGVGGIVKKGGGTLLLAGSSSYQGNTLVQEGLLVPLQSGALGQGAQVSVGGEGAAAHILVGKGVNLGAHNFLINAEGGVYGNGTLGTTVVNQGGFIRPGLGAMDFGILKVEGDLSFGDGGTYKASLSGNGVYDSDLIQVNGNVDLTNGTLHISGFPDDYEFGEYFNVMSYTGVRTGDFKDVRDDFVFLDAGLVNYGDAKKLIKLGLERNSTTFSEYALTPNQKAVAGALDQMGLNDLLDNYVLFETPEYVRNAYDLLSGEVHATLQSSLQSWGQQLGQSSLSQLRTSLDACADAGERSAAAAAQSGDCALAGHVRGWAQVLGHWNDTKTDHNAATSKRRTSGLLMGADAALGGSGWRVGGVLAYGQTHLHVAQRHSTADVSDYSAAMYAGKRWPNSSGGVWSVLGGAAYTHHRIEAERYFPRIQSAVQSAYSGRTAQLFGEVSYAMQASSRWRVEPFVGLNVAQQKLNGFEESGNGGALHARATSQTRTALTLGARLQSQLDVKGKVVGLSGSVAVKQALGALDETRTMAFQNGPDFTIAGVPLSRSTAVLGVQAQVKLAAQTVLEAGLQAEFGGKVHEQSLQVRARWAL